MFRRMINLILIVGLLLNFTGCVAVVAGVAGGAGTALWLEGKIKEELNAGIAKVVKATTSALKAMKLEITKTTVKDTVAQIMAKYTDGRTVWIDIKKISDQTSVIEIRVGMTGDKEASTKILNKIEKYL